MKLGLPIQRRIGGVLLVIGGALSSIGAFIFNFGPVEAGSLTTIAGSLFEGTALMTLSFAFSSGDIRRSVRGSFLVAGLVVILLSVLTISGVLAQGFPPVLSALLFVVLGIALLVGAIGLFRSSPAGNPAKWALLPAALFQTADLVLLFSGHGGQWWTLATLGALYVLAGVILATYNGRLRQNPEALGITDLTSSPQ